MKAFPGISLSRNYSILKVTSLISNSCTASLPLIALYPKSALSLLPKALISITSRGIKFQIFAAASGFHTQVTDTSLASPHLVQATRCSFCDTPESVNTTVWLCTGSKMSHVYEKKKRKKN